MAKHTTKLVLIGVRIHVYERHLLERGLALGVYCMLKVLRHFSHDQAKTPKKHTNKYIESPRNIKPLYGEIPSVYLDGLPLELVVVDVCGVEGAGGPLVLTTL